MHGHRVHLANYDYSSENVLANYYAIGEHFPANCSPLTENVNTSLKSEQGRFLAAASQLDRGEVRTFCMTIAYTGCRISEALELSAARVDLSAKALTFRTLKQRGKVKYRSDAAGR